MLGFVGSKKIVPTNLQRMMAMYIKYYYSNSAMYARLQEAKRDAHGKKYDEIHCQLGRVIDEAQGIFKSRARGVFKYSLENGFSDIKDPKEYLTREYGEKLELILDFGPVYVTLQSLTKDGLLDVFKSAAPEKSDTLLTLILHDMLTAEATVYADDFWRTTYARIALPNAKLKSQRLSEFLAELGEEAVYRKFFDTYLSFIVRKSKTTRHGIIVDSTGLQNDSRMDLAALNVHNGIASHEIRLILAVDRQTGYPLYFRCVKGNVLDVNTLAVTVADIRKHGIEVDSCLLDAGYYCGENIDELNLLQIPYLLRLKAGTKIYEELAAQHLGGLVSIENRVIYGKRVVFIKRVPFDFHSGKAFAFVAIDFERQADEQRRIFSKSPEDFESKEEMDEKLRTSGVFIMISKTEAATEEILPLYYSRQAVEQAFDFGKNYANLLPLRVHSEAVLRGHLMISFMATAAIMTIDRMFVKSQPKAKNRRPLNFLQARSCLRQMKCQVYDDHITVIEPDRQSNDVLKALKIVYNKQIGITAL